MARMHGRRSVGAGSVSPHFPLGKIGLQLYMRNGSKLFRDHVFGTESGGKTDGPKVAIRAMASQSLHKMHGLAETLLQK